jgi:hypothetical protein
MRSLPGRAFWWGIACAPWLFLATCMSGALMLRVMGGISPPGEPDRFEVIAIPRRAAVPVYSAPNGRQSGILTGPEILALAQPETEWLQCRYGSARSESGNPIEDACWVRRSDISFDPKEVRRVVLDGKHDFGQPGGEPFWDVQVLDANADGVLDVLWQYDVDTLCEPTGQLAYLYTVRDGIPVPLLQIRGETSPLEAIACPDGSRALASVTMQLEGTAYQWSGGRYQLLPFHAPEMRRKVWGLMAGLWWLLLLGLPPALLVLGWTLGLIRQALADWLPPQWTFEMKFSSWCFAGLTVLLAVGLAFGRWELIDLFITAVVAPVWCAAFFSLIAVTAVWAVLRRRRRAYAF